MKIPNFAIGTGGLIKNQNNGVDEMLIAAHGAKYRHIDTAQYYGNQGVVGNVVQSHKWKNVFITSKITPENYRNFAYESIVDTNKLIGKNIDLFLLHAPIDAESNAHAYKDMIRARDEGLIKACGVSNFTIAEIKQLQKDVGEFPVNNQIYISPKSYPYKHIEFCKKNGISISAYSSLRDYYLKDSSHYMTDNERTIIDNIAKKHNKKPSHVILRWLYQSDIHIITQSRTPERVIDNINIFDFELDTDDLEKIKSLNTSNGEISKLNVNTKNINFKKKFMLT